MPAEPVARWLDSRVGRDNGLSLGRGQLHRKMNSVGVAEYEVLPAYPKCGMVPPLDNVNPLSLGQPRHDALEPNHV